MSVEVVPVACRSPQRVQGPSPGSAGIPGSSLDNHPRVFVGQPMVWEEGLAMPGPSYVDSPADARHLRPDRGSVTPDP